MISMVVWDSVSKEKKCPNAPIWINRFLKPRRSFQQSHKMDKIRENILFWKKIQKNIFFNRKKNFEKKFKKIFFEIEKKILKKVKFLKKKLNFWQNFWITRDCQRIKMSARTPPGRFSIDFLLSKGNVSFIDLWITGLFKNVRP